MGEPTFKVLTARQGLLKIMLEEIGRYTLWQAAKQGGETPDWSEDRWQVTAVFPELMNKDVTKFAVAMAQVATTVVLLIDNGLLTEETGLKLVADVAQRFGQDIDAKAELAAAQLAHKKRQTDKAQADSFNLDAATRDALASGTAQPGGAPHGAQ